MTSASFSKSLSPQFFQFSLSVLLDNFNTMHYYELNRKKDAREMYEIVKQELAEEKKGQRKKKQPQNLKQKKNMNLNRTDYAGYQLSST